MAIENGADTVATGQPGAVVLTLPQNLLDLIKQQAAKLVVLGVVRTATMQFEVYELDSETVDRLGRTKGETITVEVSDRSSLVRVPNFSQRL